MIFLKKNPKKGKGNTLKTRNFWIVCSNQLITLNNLKMEKRFEVQQRGDVFRVYDNQDKIDITKDVPSKEIAQEIADDFEAMSKKDYRPIGGPDMRKTDKPVRLPRKKKKAFIALTAQSEYVFCCNAIKSGILPQFGPFNPLNLFFDSGNLLPRIHSKQ